MNKTLIGLLFLTFAAVVQAAEAPATSARNIVLVRHGNYVSDPAADPKLGPGLSPLGVAQAYLAGARLAAMPAHFDALYASPLQRARDTAAIIGENFPGRTFSVLADLEECTPPTRRTEITKDDKPEELAACKKQLDRLFDTHFIPAQGAERTEMYVCHGNVIRYLTTRALGVDTRAWLEMSVHHASITRIRVEADGRFKVINVGDSGYMPANMLTGATGDEKRSLEIPELPVAQPESD
ncbi:MAG TPA: histidine phosphatase family protein [Dokdonella sp.]|uniref:histidine phosphatase family protein n=1 Tax=Dokdonella sp. TaxID=2291710 RepID=UPI002D7E4E16|nr:histidine phosphatase family protein [Dokdonella sp.]HET9033500.1 histidine phosphatase family protein [Dokdonella sp.]